MNIEDTNIIKLIHEIAYWIGGGIAMIAVGIFKNFHSRISALENNAIKKEEFHDFKKEIADTQLRIETKIDTLNTTLHSTILELWQKKEDKK